MSDTRLSQLSTRVQEKAKIVVEFFIFEQRWLLIPFYLKLIWTMILFLIKFYKSHITSEDVVHVLEDVDVVMIANLVKMIITGSYNSFVEKTYKHAVEEVSSSALKVKMATSLVGVSSIHLLQEFLRQSEELSDWNVLAKLIVMHIVFLIGAYMLSQIDFFHAKAESLHHASNHPHAASESDESKSNHSSQSAHH